MERLPLELCESFAEHLKIRDIFSDILILLYVADFFLRRKAFK